MAEIPTRGGATRQYWRGTVTANGVTPVAFTDNCITSKSSIHFTLKTPGGTIAPMVLQTVTPGTGNVAGSFTVSSSAGNTSIYNVLIIG